MIKVQCCSQALVDGEVVKRGAVLELPSREGRRLLTSGRFILAGEPQPARAKPPVKTK